MSAHSSSQQSTVSGGGADDARAVGPAPRGRVRLRRLPPRRREHRTDGGRAARRSGGRPLHDGGHDWGGAGPGHRARPGLHRRPGRHPLADAPRRRHGPADAGRRAAPGACAAEGPVPARRRAAGGRAGRIARAHGDLRQRRVYHLHQRRAAVARDGARRGARRPPHRLDADRVLSRGGAGGGSAGRRSAPACGARRSSPAPCCWRWRRCSRSSSCALARPSISWRSCWPAA